jgi:adenylate kinase
MFSRVVIVTGTPGVGKTTISQLLAKRLRICHIGITELIQEENLILGLDVKRNTSIADLEKISERIHQILNGTSQNFVIEGHYAADVVPPHMVSYAFVLRMDPDVLRKRLQDRGYSESKIRENLASEVLDTCLSSTIEQFRVEKVDEINVTFKKIDEIIEEIIGVIEGQLKATVGKVDWLGKLEEEDRLDEFFNSLNWL